MIIWSCFTWFIRNKFYFPVTFPLVKMCMHFSVTSAGESTCMIIAMNQSSLPFKVKRGHFLLFQRYIFAAYGVIMLLNLSNAYDYKFPFCSFMCFMSNWCLWFISCFLFGIFMCAWETNVYHLLKRIVLAKGQFAIDGGRKKV